MIEFLTIHDVAISKLAFFTICLQTRSSTLRDGPITFVYDFHAQLQTNGQSLQIDHTQRHRLPRKRKDRSSSAVDRFCMRTPQVPSHALTNRDVKQMFRADLSLGLCERAWQILCPLNHADRSPFDSRSSNAVQRSRSRKYGSDSEIELYFWGEALHLHKVMREQRY